MPLQKAPVSTSRKDVQWNRPFTGRDGWQRSHRVPWQMRSSEFYQLISLARSTAPGSNAPFERWDLLDPRHNGQLLPVDGIQVLDRARHMGSHPRINEAVEARFEQWAFQLKQDLLALGVTSLDANSPIVANPAVQDLLRQYNQRARNLADVIGVASLDGFGDPNDPSNADRLVYNRKDPQCRQLSGSQRFSLGRADVGAA